jgi:hypothetical protein
VILPEVLAITLRVVEVLERLGIPCVIGGSLASSLRGVPRSTLDVDLVAEICEAHVDALVERLGPDFYADPEAIRAAMRRGHSFNIVYLTTAFKVDIFPRGPRPFDRAEFERARETEISTDPPVRLTVKTAEDILLSKLEWYRMGREVSEQQWRDVIGIIRTQGAGLDRSYLERWAHELGVADLLARAFAEAEHSGREPTAGR